MKPHSFCETPHENCTLNYCDENGCLNRKRELLDEKGQPLTYWGGLADEAFEKESDINKLAEEVYGKGVKEDYEEGYIDGYNKAKEYLYTKQDLIDLVQGLKDYTKESHTILGHDDREPIEFVDIFLNEISDDEALSMDKELNKQLMTFVPDEISDKKRNFVFSDDQDIESKNIIGISDDVLFEQAIVAMEERYGSGCDAEIDAYFRGALWMQSQLNQNIN